MTDDRATHDAVIRALADAPFRSSGEWLDRHLADPERVERFARFLGRHYYYERLVHFFKYSRALAPVTGRHPDAVLKSPAFDAVLIGAVLGSRASARAVARLAVAHVQEGSRERVPYLADLLQYEEAMMVVEAGPRVWRDVEGEEPASVRRTTAPTVVEGTAVLDLEYDLPVVLPLLLRPWTDVPTCSRSRTTLIMARSAHGRVAVARANRVIASIMELADGRKTLGDLAREAGLRPAELEATLDGLVELGALRFSTGS